MSVFATSVDEEIEDLGRTRVNALPSTVGERAAALRYRLDRVDENHADGYTTVETPGFEPGTAIEVKSVRVEHGTGRTGRLGVHPDTHEQLVAEGGEYVVVLYGEVEHDGATRIVVLAVDVVDAETIGRFVPSTATGYAKVRWDQLLDVDVDRARWSA